MKGRKLSTALLGALVGVILAGSQTVFATHTPADKVVAAGSKMVVLGPNAEAEILSATLRTSKPTDLILSVAMECSIFTGLVTGPSGDGGTDSATASGHIRAWVEIDGQIVPINSISNPPQPPPPPGDDTDKVTFCNRTYSRTVTDAEDPLDGQDIEDDFIDTKNANSFNWLRLNMGAGIHRIVVKATLLQSTQGDATAEAAIGNRSLIVEPEKLANDATI
jgi:hypothetical protein